VVYLKPKQLIIKDCARRFVSKLYRHEASRYHFATAELLVMAEAAILNFGKNVNNFGLDKDILHQIVWEDAPRRRDDPVTKSRNRKLICVTSSNEGLKHMCVDLSDYDRYLNQNWYRTQIPHYQHAGMTKFT